MPTAATIEIASLVGFSPTFTAATAELEFKLKRVQISAGRCKCVSWVSNAVERNPGSRFICRSVQGVDIHDPPIEIENRWARTPYSILMCSVQSNFRRV